MHDFTDEIFLFNFLNFPPLDLFTGSRLFPADSIHSYWSTIYAQLHCTTSLWRGKKPGPVNFTSSGPHHHYSLTFCKFQAISKCCPNSEKVKYIAINSIQVTIKSTFSIFHTKEITWTRSSWLNIDLKQSLRQQFVRITNQLNRKYFITGHGIWEKKFDAHLLTLDTRNMVWITYLI